MPMNSLFAMFASLNIEGASQVPTYQEHLVQCVYTHEMLALNYELGHPQRAWHNEQARSYQRELLGLPNP